MSSQLCMRLDYAISLYHTLNDARIICSWKHSYTQSDAQRYEADVMKEYLKSYIPSDSIITEVQSCETIGNIVYSYQYIQTTWPLHLVTSASHIPKVQAVIAKIVDYDPLDIIFHPAEWSLQDGVSARDQAVISLYDEILPDRYTIEQIKRLLETQVVWYAPDPVWTAERIQEWITEWMKNHE